MPQFLVYLKNTGSVARLKGKIIKTWPSFPRTVLVEVPANQETALRASLEVEAVDLDTTVETLDIKIDNIESESYTDSWGVRFMNAPEVHASGNTGVGVRLLIIDTGGMTSHEDIVIAGGRNFITPGASWEDDNGHGTHVHGIAAAKLNGFGVAGVAPNSEVYHGKVLDNTGSGFFSTIVDALQYAIDLTEGGTIPVVTNNSYGSAINPGVAIEAAFQGAADAGVHLICAAGNSSAGPDTIIWPAKYSSCVAVGSIDETGNRSAFSSTGPAVEVMAGGSLIFSTCMHVVPNIYCFKSGTSMACPHIAGAFCLAVSAGVSDPRAAIPLSTDRTTERTNDFGFGILDCVKFVSGGSEAIFSWHVKFDGSFSTDEDGTIVSTRWDVLGDGTFTDHGSDIIEHTYDADGIYNVALEVTDDEGATNIIIHPITVQAPTPPQNIPPVAEFVVTDLGSGTAAPSSKKPKKTKKVK